MRKTVIRIIAGLIAALFIIATLAPAMYQLTMW